MRCGLKQLILLLLSTFSYQAFSTQINQAFSTQPIYIQNLDNLGKFFIHGYYQRIKFEFEEKEAPHSLTVYYGSIIEYEEKINPDNKRIVSPVSFILEGTSYVLNRLSFYPDGAIKEAHIHQLLNIYDTEGKEEKTINKIDISGQWETKLLESVAALGPLNKKQNQNVQRLRTIMTTVKKHKPCKNLTSKKNRSLRQGSLRKSLSPPS